MANEPKITFSTNPNPRNRALIDELVSIDGYQLEYIGTSTRPARCIIGLSGGNSMSPRCRARR